MHIALITLDLDDTLWPCLPVIRAAEQSLYDWLREHAPGVTRAHDLDSLRHHRLALAQQQPQLAHDVTALRLAQLQALMRDHDHPVQLAAQAAAHFRRARNRVAPYPEVATALQRLRRRYRLVSITNGNAQLEHTPLAGYFDHSLTAGDVGAAKPDPALFLTACAWAQVSPAQTLHVGDDPLRDIVAARDLGMRSAWIDRERREWPAGLPPADLAFDSLTALADHLLPADKEAES